MGTGGKRPAASGQMPAALSAADLAALTDTPAILKAVQKAQAAAGQTFRAQKAAAGEAPAGETSTAEKAAGVQAALGRAALGQTTAAGRVIAEAMQPGDGGASSSPPAAVQQAAGAAASAIAALWPSAKHHLQEVWSKLTPEAAQRSKIAYEEDLLKALKAATKGQTGAVIDAKPKYAEVGWRVTWCCRAVQLFCSIMQNHIPVCCCNVLALPDLTQCTNAT